MAVVPDKGSSLFSLPASINRLKALPTDTSELWFSLAEAQTYVSTDPTAYVGQFVVVYDKEGDKTVKGYLIDGNSQLQEIGAVVDETGSGIEVVTALPEITETEEGRVVYLQATNAGSSSSLYLARTSISADGTPTKAWVSVATSDALANLGGGDMLKSDYDTDGDGVVDVARSFSGSLKLILADGTTKTFKGTEADVEISAEVLGALKIVPVATEETTGGVKSSKTQDSVTVNSDGTMTVNDLSASKIKGKVSTAEIADKTVSKLTIVRGDGEIETFDGSSEISISAETLGALTSVDHPIATSETAGIVKPGETLTIGQGGEINVNFSKATPATNSAAGVVKPISSDFNISTDGTLSLAANVRYNLPTASTITKGGVKVDGETLIVDSSTEVAKVGTISGNQVSGGVASANMATTAANYVDSEGKSSSIKDALLTKLDKSAAENEVKKLAGVTGGYAPLDNNKKIDQAYLPSYVDDIIEGVYVNETTFTVFDSAIALETGKIYVDTITNAEYRFTGTKLVSISNPLDYATVEEAQAMTDTTKVMSPARTKDAIQSAPINVAQLFIAEGDTLILNCGNSKF